MGGRPRVRVCVAFVPSAASSLALAAGVSWTLVIASAPWAARHGHTSVVDAAGAIYVIGGYSGNYPNDILLHDVWVSTDGGA